MAERLAYLEAVIGADITQFRKGMRDIRNETGILSETMRGVSGLGRTLTFAYTTPLLVLGSTAVGVASDFDAAMKNINAIAGLTGDELDALSQRTLEFGKTTRAGAIGSAEALYTVFSSGLTDVTQAFATMEIASMTAEAGLANVNTTTEALVGSMLAYGDTSEENAQRTSDALTQMVALGVGSMDNFANAIGSVTPAAVGLGVEVEELYADVAFLTQQNFSASRATTALNAALTSLAKPTTAMQAAMHKLGVTGATDLVDKFGNVNEAIVALVQTTDGSLESINALFGNARGARAINTFMNNLDAWRGMTEEFKDTVGGATLRAWESQMDSFAATSDKFKSAIQGLGIVIGQALFPVLTPVLKGLTDFVNGISSANPKIIAMGVAFLGVTAALPPLIWLFGSLFTPIGLVIGAVGALVTAFAVDFAGVRTSVTTTVQGVIDDLMPLWDTLTSIFDLITGAAPEVGTPTVLPDPLAVNPTDIITVTQPKSLWQIYEEEGYADLFSWQDFMDEALAGGWEGGAVTPDTPIILNPEYQMGGTDPMLDAIRYAESVKPYQVDQSLFMMPDNRSPMERELDNLKVELQTQLQTLWDDTKALIDEKAGTLLEGLIEWFSPAGGADQLIATSAGVLSNLLQGNFLDAIGVVSPSLEQSLRDMIGDGIVSGLEGEFPEISASLPVFWDTFTGWLTDSAVPNTSKGIGWVSGKIASTLFSGITDAISYVFSGGAGKDAGTLLSDITTWLNDHVVTPFSDGITEALEGTELQTAIDTVTGFIDGLQEHFEIDGGSVDLSGFQDLADGISSAIDSLAGADWSGVAKLGVIIALIGGAAFDLAMDVLNGLGSGLGLIISEIGDGLASIVDAMALAGEGDWEGGFAKLGQALIDFGFAVLQVPATVIDTIVSSILDLFNLDVPSIGDWLDGLKDDIDTGIDNWINGRDDPIDLTLADLINVDLTGNEAMIQENMGLLAEMLDTSLQDLWASETTVANAMPLNFEWDADATSAMQMLNSIIANPDELPAAREVAATIRQTIFDDLNENGIEIPPAALRLPDGTILPMEYVTLEDGTVVTLPNPTFSVTGKGRLINDKPLEPSVGGATANVLPPTDWTFGGMFDTAVPVEEPVTLQPTQPVDMTGVSLAFSEELLSGTDAQSIIDANFIPLETAWVAMFAAEGLMAMTFGTFSTGVTTGWTDMDTGANTFMDNVTARLPEVSGVFETEVPRWTSAIDPFLTTISSAKNIVNELMLAIKSLLSLEGELSVSVTVEGTVNGGADGSAAGGLKSVPFDGFMAELHKGERVLTNEEAKAYNEGGVPMRALMPNESSSGGTSNTVINVQSKVTVDEFISEMKRRGYKIDKT